MIKLLIIIFFFPNFLNSQQIVNNKKNGKPIEIFAEQGIEWHKNEKKYLAIGNAMAKSGTMSLNSDRIEAFYEEKDQDAIDIKIVKAHNNVKVKDNDLEITGGRLAEYDLKKDFFSIFGKKLILTSEENQLKSNKKMEYWRTKGVAIATGKSEAKKGNEFTIKAEKLVWYLNEYYICIRTRWNWKNIFSRCGCCKQTYERGGKKNNIIETSCRGWRKSWFFTRRFKR